MTVRGQRLNSPTTSGRSRGVRKGRTLTGRQRQGGRGRFCVRRVGVALPRVREVLKLYQ
jgi:hypothetical protein